MKVYECVGENDNKDEQSTNIIHGHPGTLRMLRAKTDKFHWFWSQCSVYKAFKTRMSVDLVRDRDSWC